MEKASILIADDERNLCRILEAELRKAGYSVVTVHDGTAAVEEARQSDFQAIVLDVKMPVLDGLGALQEIRTFRKDTPIIMMTAYGSNETSASALSMGATACVDKPFDLGSLVALIKATLGEESACKCDLQDSLPTILFSREQSIFLSVLDGRHPAEYESWIEDKNDHSLIVASPWNGDGYVMPGAGTPVSIGFAGEDAFYSFETTVLSKRDGCPPGIVVGKPAMIYRVQRRKYPRMIARIPVEVTAFERRDGDSEVIMSFSVLTDNIGIGGLKIVTENELPESAELKIKAIEAPDEACFSARGKVAHSHLTSVNSLNEWEYGIQFTRIDEDSLDRLRGLTQLSVRT